jgi:hypothetical protein
MNVTAPTSAQPVTYARGTTGAKPATSAQGVANGSTHLDARNTSEHGTTYELSASDAS